jgi:hypothetical protein
LVIAELMGRQRAEVAMRIHLPPPQSIDWIALTAGSLLVVGFVAAIAVMLVR